MGGHASTESTHARSTFSSAATPESRQEGDEGWGTVKSPGLARSWRRLANERWVRGREDTAGAESRGAREGSIREGGPPRRKGRRKGGKMSTTDPDAHFWRLRHRLSPNLTPDSPKPASHSCRILKFPLYSSEELYLQLSDSPPQLLPLDTMHHRSSPSYF